MSQKYSREWMMRGGIKEEINDLKGESEKVWKHAMEEVGGSIGQMAEFPEEVSRATEVEVRDALTAGPGPRLE